MDQASELDLARQVRTADYDRFLCIQLAPAKKRAALYAVTAFHAELARIAETVSEPLLGHIRLAWWREALEELAAGKAPRQHPVVLALCEVLAQHPPIHAELLRMLEARAMDLDTSLMAEEPAWLGYLDATAGALHLSWAHILDVPSLSACHAPILQAARAYAMVGLVRAIPYLAANGFLRFPQARMQAAGLESLVPGTAIAALVAPILDEALGLLAASRTLPESFLALRGLHALASLHLRRMRKNGCDPFRGENMRVSSVLKIIQVKFCLC